jgi:hypothetical protein
VNCSVIWAATAARFSREEVTQSTYIAPAASLRVFPAIGTSTSHLHGRSAGTWEFPNPRPRRALGVPYVIDNQCHRLDFTLPGLTSNRELNLTAPKDPGFLAQRPRAGMTGVQTEGQSTTVICLTTLSRATEILCE